MTVIFGILAMLNMRKSFFPEIPPRIITIAVAYPGASPAEMEEGVTTKIEQAVEGLSGIKKITSSSEENLASIRIEAYEDTDMDELLTDVENTVNSINSFPVGAEKPIVRKLKVGEMGGTAAFLALTGPDDLWELKAKAEQVKNDFLASPFVSQIQVVGYPDVEISVEVKEEKLLEYGLRFDQVVAAVRGNNLDLSAGTIKTNEEEYLIRMRGRETMADEIGNIVLRANNEGEFIRLSNVAEVKFQFADRPMKSFLDGKRAVTLIVNKLPDEDLGGIADFVRNYSSEFNTKNPGYNLRIIFQFEEMLQERIDLLTSNGWQGFLLVMLCLGFFLSLRVSFWVAFGIPISFLGLFAIGWVYGMTINMISLFGMIIVIGILVDDGIVISENIYAHFERGKSPMRAAIDGTLEVFSCLRSYYGSCFCFAHVCWRTI
jgi:multidrug efflux pump subunit AcrB